ncbi:NACHT nucleoside triphosphatase [Penicillium canescens]|nr:NACHT nucleoside triphosphatase [Penicillium canescens]
MADPLTIASGIAGLLSLGIQVTQSLLSFYTTYKDQDTDLAKVTQKLDNLLGIFRALDIVVEERRSQADTQDLLREVEKAVQQCEEIITELQSECREFHEDSTAGLKVRVKVAGRRAAYPFRKSTLQKLEEDVSDIRENLLFALDVLQLKSQRQIQDGISEVKSLVEQTNASQVSLAIRCWLMAPDASLNHNAACAKCHPSTGLWFVNGYHFRTWLEERNSFLWLNGFAGCGKSVLCLTAIQHTFQLIDAHAVDLSEPLHIDRDGRSYEQDDLVDICLGLIEITATGSKDGQSTLTARIAHFSVQEYLQSDRILQQKSKIFAIQSATANEEIARICLVYLLEPSLSRGPSGEKELTEFPLARFAARHWFHYYANSGKGNSGMEQLVLKLFKDETESFPMWVRLYDIDHCWESGAKLLLADKASPLYYAALLGLESVLNSILQIDTRDADPLKTVNAQAGVYGNVLQAASYGGHEKVVQMLLDRGADVNAQGGLYGSALQAASLRGLEKAVQMFLDRGADVNSHGGMYGSALQAASLRGHEKVVQMLLDRDADVNAQGGQGSALQAASSEGHEKLVQMLLDRDADVNAQFGFSVNALQAASSRGHEKVVRMLLDRGADVNAQPLRGGNVLQAASTNGHEKVVRMLLDHGADANAQSGQYGSALQAASSGGHEKVVQMLLDHGADANAQSGQYGSALQAASSGAMKMWCRCCWIVVPTSASAVLRGRSGCSGPVKV